MNKNIGFWISITASREPEKDKNNSLYKGDAIYSSLKLQFMFVTSILLERDDQQIIKWIQFFHC